MDDRYREGFERLLSDMDEPPSWDAMSTHKAAVKPSRRRSHGLLVAAAAFAATILAVGAVVFALQGDGAPVATPSKESIDHIELTWEQTIDLRCEGMDTFDSGGFSEAKIDIWGPNADGLVRVDATAPDGTVQRVIHTAPADDLSIERVWSSFDWASFEDQIYRVARCVVGEDGGTDRYSMSDPPIHPRGHDFGMFVSLPAESPNGSLLDIEAIWLDAGAAVTAGEWRGIPVKVYTHNDAWSDSAGTQTHTFDTWFDPVGLRFERQRHVTDFETLGTVTTNVEVVMRETVPSESVSFSTAGLELTWQAPPGDPSDGTKLEITTTLPTSAISPWTDQQLSDAARIWVNQIGLNQSNPEVWRSRLDRICAIGPIAGDADTAMNTLAGEFIAEDAALSVRADGKLPTSDEAVESLWTIAISPVCLEASLTGTTVPDSIDVAAFDDVGSIDAEINRRHALIDEVMAKRDDAERKIRQNQEILEALEAQADPVASQEVIERQRVIVRVAELEREQAEETLTRLEAIMADLRARHAELVAIVEAQMAMDRTAAEARAAQNAPYLVEEPIGLEPPSALPGNGGASGSGCYPGPGDLPDGIWFGYLLDRDGPTIDFDLDCMYFGEAARAFSGESGTDADGDIVFVKFDTVVRTLPVAATATVWMITGDATEGHQALPFAREWTGDESTYASCPGEGCPVWVYVNGGTVDAIVQQYLP